VTSFGRVSDSPSAIRYCAASWDHVVRLEAHCSRFKSPGQSPVPLGWILRIDRPFPASLSSQQLPGYTDADRAGDLATGRSTAGFKLHSRERSHQLVIKATTHCSPLLMRSRVHGTSSTCKGSHLATQPPTGTAGPGRETVPATVIFGDNQGAIALAKNPQFHARTKHIDIQNHFIRKTAKPACRTSRSESPRRKGGGKHKWARDEKHDSWKGTRRVEMQNDCPSAFPFSHSRKKKWQHNIKLTKKRPETSPEKDILGR